MSLASLITPFGVAIAGKATLLIGIGWCVAVFMRKAPAVARHLVWLTVIMGALVVPFVARYAAVPVPILPEAIPSAPSVHASPIATASPATISAPTYPPANAAIREPQDRAVRLPAVVDLLSFAWLLVVLLLATRLVRGMFATAAIARRSRPLDGAEWTGLLSDLSQRVGVKRTPRLVISAEIEVPFACNVFAPTIVLPADARTWSISLRRAVLTHELAHVKRHDLAGHAIASFACVIYWFNPFVWTAARRLRTESELASDDIVLECGVRPSEYAQHLLDLVTTLRQHAPRTALAIVRPRDFEGRLVAILERTQHGPASVRVHSRAVVGMLGAVTLSIASIAPVPRVVERVVPPEVHHTTVTLGDTARRTPDGAPKATTRRATSAARRPLRFSSPSLSALLRAGTGSIVNPMQLMLRLADSLQLSGMQADSIATLNRAYAVTIDPLWRPILHFYATHPAGEEVGEDLLMGATVASMRALESFALHTRGLLTEVQRSRVPLTVARLLDPANLARLRESARSDPDVAIYIQPGGGARGSGGIRRPESPRGRAGG